MRVSLLACIGLAACALELPAVPADVGVSPSDLGAPSQPSPDALVQPPPAPGHDAEPMPSDPDAAELPPPLVPDFGPPPDAAACAADHERNPRSGICERFRFVFEAEGPQMRHETGQAAPQGWHALAVRHARGRYLLAGPFVDAVPVGRWVTTWFLRWEAVGGDARDRLVARLTVSDADACPRHSEVCPLHPPIDLRGRDLGEQNVLQPFDAVFDNPGGRHKLEFRVFWTGAADLFVDKVEVVRLGRGPP